MQFSGGEHSLLDTTQCSGYTFDLMRQAADLLRKRALLDEAR